MNKLNNELSYMVSNIDIMKKLKQFKKYVNVIIYENLEGKSTIDDILPYDKCCCFILIRTSNDSGHWSVVCRNNTNIYYFDSYGIKPDGELHNIPENQRYILDENRPLLSHLIYTMPLSYNFHYNKTQFQQYTQNNGVAINTCGKHCISFVYCVLNDVTLDEYTQRMKQLKDDLNLDYDYIVCLMYNAI